MLPIAPFAWIDACCDRANPEDYRPLIKTSTIQLRDRLLPQTECSGVFNGDIRYICSGDSRFPP